MLEITWKSPCPHGARRATSCMWSDFIFHGHVQSSIYPCKIIGKPSQGQPHHCWVFIQFSSVQFSRSVMSDSLQPQESQHTRPPCPSPTPGVYPLMSIKSVMPSSHLILCRPLLLLPPIPPNIKVFSNESTLHMRWPKYLEFQL